MIEGYLRARQLFKSHQRAGTGDHLLSFQTLREICDILYQVKEDHHLLFRRGSDDSLDRNDNHKFVPGPAESAFIDNVGLLFHKVMVARELRYLLQHYAKDNEMWENHVASLTDNLEKINRLFDEGVKLVVDLMRAYTNNVLLITFIVENDTWVCNCLNMRRAELLKELCQEDDCERAYLQVADYYAQSGWYDKAQTILKDVLRKNPQYEAARETLKRLSSKNESR